VRAMAPERSGDASRDVLLRLLDQGVADARLRLLADGGVFVVGRGPSAPDVNGVVTIRVRRPRFFSRTVAHGSLGLAEAFMDGDFDVDDGRLPELLTILLRNRLDAAVRRNPRLLFAVLWVRLRNLIQGTRRNVRRHYDLGDDLFESFLDRTLTYSCGYAEQPDDDLDQLQAHKLERISRKLQLREGDRLLDIGCGFGGLLIHAAQHHGVTGVGFTTSVAHAARAALEVERQGLSARIRIRCADFRSTEGRFTKVVTVGMMEHVLRRDYGVFFRTIADALEPEGLGLVHTIGCNSFRNEHDPFFQKYIFPGSDQPRLSEIAGHLEGCRLAILDVENIKRHYGYTVRRWLERFQRARDALDPARYDAAFKRMWEYYLSCGIAAAAVSTSAVFQVLFAKSHTLPVPLRRV
jgi:cyclopropane-fatty-acyl-phospholipid synthase